jgi:hypothetical protein
LQQMQQTNGSSSFGERVFWAGLGATEWSDLDDLELVASPRSLEPREDCLREEELEP